jgi:peptidoglycan-associated lipoprotein
MILGRMLTDGSLARSMAAVVLVGVLAGCGSPSKPPPRQFDYVVLLPNADGTVGKVLIKGSKGAQTLDIAQNGASLAGDAAAFAVSTAQLQTAFGPAMAARPELPEHFYLYFESGGSNLTPESLALVVTILERAQARISADVSVIGHTDTTGKAEANASLALRRATSIATLLRERGLQPATLTIESHGESNLLVATPDETPEPRNRRVEITIR